ncbi:MAG: ComEC/Rec2 family competence protein [Candidatus Improbicoccus devescovinae]|nr:MAG: ComEC/Rec2 family competence protein [Candidatus Improbicoccus devescovinae]
MASVLDSDMNENSIVKLPVLIFSFSFVLTLICITFLSVDVVIYCSVVFGLLAILNKFLFKNNYFLIVFLAGILAISVFFINFYTKIKPILNLKKEKLIVTGLIIENPYQIDDKFYYLLKVYNVENFKKIPSFKLEIISPVFNDLEIGDKIKANINLIPNENFNTKINYYSRNIYKFAYFNNYNKIQIIENTKEEYFLQKNLLIKKKIQEKINELFDFQTAPFISTLWFAEYHEINRNLKEKFSNLGIAYLLVMSNLHVFILVSFWYFLFYFLFKKKQISEILCILVIICFMCITCFRPSIVRIGIINIIRLLGSIFFRRSYQLNSLAISIFILIIINPNSCVDLSLWFSIAATLGNLVSPKKYFKYKKIKAIYKYLLFNIFSSISVSVSTLPLLIIYLKRISFLSIIINIFAIPYVSVLLILSMLSISINFFANLNIFVNIINYLVNLIITCVNYLSTFSFLTFGVHYSFIRLWISFTLILISLIFFIEEFYKEKIKIYLSSIIILLSGIISYKLYNMNKIISTFLCNDMNCSIVINKNKETLIILLENNNLFFIRNYLENLNIKKVECLIDVSEKINMINNLKDIENSIDFMCIKNIDNNSDIEENFSFFNGIIKIQIYKIKGKIWLKLLVTELNVLMCVDGGDVSTLPDNIKKCNIFFARSLPFNFKELRFDDIILAMNHKFINNNKKKLRNFNVHIADNQNFSIDYDYKYNKYSFRRRI